MINENSMHEKATTVVKNYTISKSYHLRLDEEM